MGQTHNVLLRFKRLGAAIQLAQWWDELAVSRTLSQLGRVLVIYGHNQAPLKDQVLEPRLHSPVNIMSMTEPLDETVSAPVLSEKPNRQSHELRNGKAYSCVA